MNRSFGSFGMIGIGNDVGGGRLLCTRTSDGLSAQWPIRYQDREPYHSRQIYNVHGRRYEDRTASHRRPEERLK